MSACLWVGIVICTNRNAFYSSVRSKSSWGLSDFLQQLCDLTAQRSENYIYGIHTYINAHETLCT